MNLSDIVILNIDDADYACSINRICNSEAIKLMQNVDLTEKCGTLWITKIHKVFKSFESMYKNG